MLCVVLCVVLYWIAFIKLRSVVLWGYGVLCCVVCAKFCVVCGCVVSSRVVLCCVVLCCVAFYDIALCCLA